MPQRTVATHGLRRLRYLRALTSARSAAADRTKCIKLRNVQHAVGDVDVEACLRSRAPMCGRAPLRGEAGPTVTGLGGRSGPGSHLPAGTVNAPDSQSARRAAWTVGSATGAAASSLRVYSCSGAPST